MAFLEGFTNILLFLLVLTVIVSIHELGHYLLAKRAGILIHEYSIGMGPVIVQTKKGETFYSLRAIPLGGYVSMSGENGDNALIKKNQVIGINLNEVGIVKEIILDQSIKNPSIIGEVVDFDLYGEDFKDLFIDIKTEDGLVTKYQVSRDAKYLYRVNKEIQVTPHESSFASKTLWQRFLVLFFGPLMNFLLALVILFIVAIVQGKPLDNNVVASTLNSELLEGDTIKKINGIETNNIVDIRNALNSANSNKVNIEILRDNQIIVKYIYVTVEMQNFSLVSSLNSDNKDLVIVGKAAEKAAEAGLKEKDRIIAVNGVAISSWDEIISIAKGYDKKDVTLKVLRDGAELTFTYEALSKDLLNSLGYEDVSMKLGFNTGYAFDIVYIFTYPFTQFVGSVKEMGVTLGLLFNPKSGVGVGDLAGPVGIFSLVSRAKEQGIISLLGFVAFLSVNIGLMNLLPIPALDGGRILFLGYEAVTRKKVPAKFEIWVNNISFFLLLGLLIFVSFNDVGRLLR